MTTSNILSQLGSPGVSTGFKNRIINGDFKISQYNGTSTASVPAGGAIYAIDRFGMARSTTGTYTVQQSSTAPSGFAYSYYILNNNGNTPAAGDFNFLYQKIEGFNIADLGWGTANAKTVTLSFWVRSSATGTFGGSLRNSAGNRSYPYTYTVSSANTWEYETITIAGDTSGTWLTTNGNGIEVDFDLGSGSTFRGTAGSWSSGNFIGASGTSQNPTITTSATFYITGVQLEVGTTATNFDFRSYGTELALCQRYYEKSYNTETAPATANTVGCVVNFTAAFSVFFPICFKVQKRATPTLVGYSTFDGSTGNFALNNSSNIALTGIISQGQSGACAYYGTSPGNSSNYLHFTASAEL